MKRKTANSLIVLILAISITMIAYSITRANADGIVPTVQTDKTDYSPEDLVTIYGTSFTPNAPITVNVTRPDGVMTSSLDNLSGPHAVTIIYNPDGTSDDAGSFTVTYQLDGITGTYNVTATDGTNTATTTFTDSIQVSAIASSNSGGTPTTSFLTTSNVYINFTTNGNGNVTVNVYVVTSIPSEGQTLSDFRGSWTSITLTTTKSQNSLVWSAPTTTGTYYLVLDYDSKDTPDGKYNAATPKNDLVSSAFTISYPAVTMTVSYSVSDGGSPTAPVFHYVDTSGTSQNYTLTTSAHSITTVGAGTAWSVTPNPLTGSTSTEQWYSTDTLSGNAPSGESQTKVFTFVHQLKHTITSSPATGSGYVTVDSVAQATPYTTPWWDSGSSHTIAANSIVTIVSGQSQYIYSSWSDSGTQSHSVSPTAVTTYTANFQLQYYFNVSSTYDSPTGERWYNSKSSVSSTITRPVSGGTGIQYETTGWTGTGSLSSGGSAGSSSTGSFTLDAYTTCTWNWKTQYYLTVTSDHDTATGEGWYESAATPSVGMTDTTVSGGTGVQYVFTGWSSSDTGGYTGSDAPHTVTMNNPITETAQWKTQYLVTFKQTGSVVAPKVTYHIDSGSDVQDTVEFSVWVDSGHQITYSYESPVSGGTGTQYVLTDTSPTSPQTVSSAFDVTGTYKTQYYITVTSAHDTPTTSAWVDQGTDFTASVTSPADIVANDHQWVCTGYTLDANAPVTDGTKSYGFTDVQSAHTIVFNWKEQFWIAVSSAHDSPTASDWVDQGTDFTASVTSPTETVAKDNQWVCTGFKVDSGSLTPGISHTFTSVASAHTIEFDWKQQFYLTVDTSPASIDSPTGEGWYDTGVTAHVTTAQYDDIVPGSSRYRFDSWTGASGTYLDATVVMGSAKTATANYVVQYYITVTSAHDSPTASAWVDQGTDFTASVTSPADIVANDHQWVCTGYSIDGGASTSGTSYKFTSVASAHTIVFSWKEQFWIQVNSAHDTPTLSAWVDQGTDFTASVTSPADIVANDHQFVCTGYKLDGGSLTAGTTYTFSGVAAKHTIEFDWKQ